MSKKFNNFLNRSLNFAAIVLFAAIFIDVLLQIFFRYILNDPLVWTEELARYLFVWLCFTGWLIASRHGDHITIVILSDRYPPMMGKIMALITQCGYITLAAILIWQGGFLFRRNLSVETVTLFFPFALVYMVVPIAGILITIIALEEIAQILRGTTS